MTASGFPGGRAASVSGQTLEGLEVLNYISNLSSGEPERFDGVIVVDRIPKGWEPPIVVKATLLMTPEAIERSRPVMPVRRSIRLQVIDPDFLSAVHVPAGSVKSGGT
jgi:hypothetical protein